MCRLLSRVSLTESSFQNLHEFGLVLSLTVQTRRLLDNLEEFYSTLPIFRAEWKFLKSRRRTAIPFPNHVIISRKTQKWHLYVAPKAASKIRSSGFIGSHQNKGSSGHRPEDPGDSHTAVRGSLRVRQKAVIYGWIFIEILMKIFGNSIFKENGLWFS